MEKIKSKQKIATGRWTRAEHNKFMDALQKYGRNWDLVQKKIGSRTLLQVRSHAQKVFLNMSENDIDAIIGFEEKASQEKDNIKLSTKSEDISSQKFTFENCKNKNAIKIVENNQKSSQNSYKLNQAVYNNKNFKNCSPEKGEKNSVSQTIQKKEQIKNTQTVLQVENLFKMPICINSPYYWQIAGSQIFFWNSYTFSP